MKEVFNRWIIRLKVYGKFDTMLTPPGERYPEMEQLTETTVKYPSGIRNCQPVLVASKREEVTGEWRKLHN